MKTLNYRYLPEGDIRKQYAYNDYIESKLQQDNDPWSSIVPNNGDENDFKNKIVAFCVEEIGLKKYKLKV